MARSFIRKFSLRKILGAYKALWKRWLGRLTRFGYGRKGMGWWRDPKRAWYNFWYNRTSVSLSQLFGVKRTRGASLFGALIACLFFPDELVDTNSTSGGGKTTKGSNPNKLIQSKNASGKPSDGDTASKRTTITPKPKTEQKQTGAQTKSANKPVVPVADRLKPVRDVQPPIVPEQESKSIPSEPKPKKKPEPPLAAVNEDAPKSAPQHPDDQYIRKRMIIAGSSYCDRTVLELLSAGAYIELAAEPDNPHDGNAVKLLYQGEKIGYVPKADSFAFATCLKMGRKVYGIITDIKEDGPSVRYEFETWFSQGE